MLGRDGTRQRLLFFLKKIFAECHFLALGKGPLCRVPGPALGKFCFLFFLPHYFFAALIYYLKLHVQIWHNFDFFCYISLVFFVSLNFMEYFKFELQVHGIIEFGRSKNDINDIWCMLRPYPGTHMKFQASC